MKIDKVALHKEIVLELNEMYRKKNNDYGDSFKRTRDKHSNTALIHLNEKLDRLETLIGGQEQKVNDETIEDTLLDLANYAILELMERKL